MANVNSQERKLMEDIDYYLSHVSGEHFDKCDYLYHVIVSADKSDQPSLFEHVCFAYEAIDSAMDRPAEQSKYNKDELETMWGELVNSIIKRLVDENASEDAFYTRMWHVLNDSALFANEAERVFAFYYAIIDKRVPYFRINIENSYAMSNDKYKQLRQQYLVDCQKIRFIMKARIQQKTEMASLILDEFGINLQDPEDVRLRNEYERKLMMMTTLLDESINRRLDSVLQSIGSL